MQQLKQEHEQGQSVKVLNGTCLCGKVYIQIPDKFEYMGFCHCSECRKFSGADYASVGGVNSDDVSITGEPDITYYAKNDETDLAFCSCCGSSLFTRKNTGRKHNIRLGILNDTPTDSPSFHIHTASKARWDNICDGLPQFTEGPPVK